VLSPLATLSRGYSITSRLDDNTVVSDASCLAIGDQLLIGFRCGGAMCRVEDLVIAAEPKA